MTARPASGSAAGSLADAPVVAEVVRSGFVESLHHGHVVATGPDGQVLWSLGSPGTPMFPRSSNKPLQAVAMLRCGLDLDGAPLALACASHSGEPFHLDAVRDVLARAGLGEADLQNTADLPYDEQERRAWLAAGLSPTALAQNCSGKHAAMLATCVARGWDRASYRQADHPLQLAVGATLADLAGEPVAATGVDGCGAPVMALSLTGLARAFGRIASARRGAEARVGAAMRGFPTYLGGSRRDVTALVAGVPGLVAKDGAEAVYAAGLADGRGVAVKIADGSGRARPVVLAAALRRLGLTGPVLDQLSDAPVLGHGERVGEVRAVLG
ncbi:MAG TPA: asparaginase [Dermatophilaceae bacterium]|nr:asparaginase [Dermatophilaceae bacterium]